jgi:hypothetical protein
MADSIKVELVYRGTDVEDGTVPVNDMVDALVGFSGAFDKIARRQELPETAHRIRVVGLERGSAKIIIEALDWVAKNPQAAGVIVSAGGLVGAGVYTTATVWIRVAQKMLTKERPSVSLSNLSVLTKALAPLAEWRYWSREQKRTLLAALVPEIRVADYEVESLGLNPAIFSNENTRSGKGSWRQRA